MTKLIPTLNSCLSTMTGGEKRMAQSLEDNLEDDYTVWYDVPIGAKQFRPDFIILHPQRGILVLEVKDWKLTTIQTANCKSVELLIENRIKSVTNPLEQARKYVLAINQVLCNDRDLVQPTGKYQGQLICPYGYGVVLANITRKAFERSDLGDVLSENLIICQDEIKPTEAIELQERLWNMFPYTFSKSIAPQQVDRIRWLMFPECRLPSKQLLLFLKEHPLVVPDPDGDLDLPVTPLEIPTDLIQIFDLKQETLARSLGDGHRVIHGVAGSGKTMVLLYRCSYLAAVNPEKPILVLCFNVTLAARLKEAIVSQSLNGTVDVRHFHDWCKHQLKSHNIRLPQFSDNYITDLENTVREAISSGRIPGKQYSSILIDEGHDFEPEWFKMLTSTLDEQDSLLLLYDDAQNLYGSQQKRKKFSFKSVGIKAQGRTSVLKTNYRNTVEVLNLAYEFAKEVMQPNESDDDDEPVLIQPQSAGRHGHSPQLLACGSFADEVKQAISLVQKLHSEGVPWNEMGILYRVKFMGETIYTQFQAANLPIEWLNKDAASRSYQPKLDSIKLMTMHSCKGLEFSSVIIPGLGYLPNQYSIQADEARLLYVAMTRSTERLILSYHQESAFVKLLQEIALNRSLATYPLNCQ